MSPILISSFCTRNARSMSSKALYLATSSDGVRLVTLFTSNNLPSLSSAGLSGHIWCASGMPSVVGTIPSMTCRLMLNSSTSHRPLDHRAPESTHEFGSLSCHRGPPTNLARLAASTTQTSFCLRHYCAHPRYQCCVTAAGG